MSIAAVVAIVLVFFAYQKYLDYADKKRFSELKADMLSLQAEFNKIEPGWEYSEGCTAGGTVFDEEAHKGCSIELQNNKGEFGDYSIRSLSDTFSRYAIEKGYFKSVKDRGEYIEDGMKHDTVSLEREGITEGRCFIDSTSYSVHLACRNDARDFYFKRVD